MSYFWAIRSIRSDWRGWIKVGCVLLGLGLGLVGVVVGYKFVRVIAADTLVSVSSETAKDPRIADMIAGGWLPGWFPAGARNIIHEHDVDTNVSLTLFEFERCGANDDLTSCCEPMAGLGGIIVPDFSYKVERWNREKITEGVNSGGMKAFSFWSGEEGFERWILVINSGSGICEGFLWNKPRY